MEFIEECIGGNPSLRPGGFSGNDSPPMLKRLSYIKQRIMICKVNQFFGGDETTFPKVARLAGSKTRIVEIQAGQKIDLREMLGIDDSMLVEDMQEISRNQEVWVVTEPVVRTLAGLATVVSLGIDQVPATDADGEVLDDLYVVPAYTVNVVSHVATDMQNALQNELDLESKKSFIEGLEFGLADKTQLIMKKALQQEEDNAAKAIAARNARIASNTARIAALKAKNVPAAAETVAAAEPLILEKQPA